ncbi:MAG: hypothetical protein CM15mP115_15440 [Alphaproteobacteria bacterium]|nr:MAG: hypothetical protein CM15mP115_15440 [Alphaproteobacteria bacterium]
MKARGYGRILNVASIAGKEGNPNASAYSASKAAVIGLTKSLGKELAGYDIAVNCVTPAAARTRIFDQMSEEHIDYMLSKIPRGRFMDVAEAAKLIVWTVSPENSFTTGAVFDLSGGRATVLVTTPHPADCPDQLTVGAERGAKKFIFPTGSTQRGSYPACASRAAMSSS